MIDTAKIDDIPCLIGLIEKMRQESRYKIYELDEEGTQAHLELAIDRGVIFVSKKDTEIVGLLAILVNKHPLLKFHYACDMVFYVDPEYRNGYMALRLLKAAKVWRKALDIPELIMGVSTGIKLESTDRLFKFAGFDPLGFSYLERQNVH